MQSFFSSIKHSLVPPEPPASNTPSRTGVADPTEFNELNDTEIEHGQVRHKARCGASSEVGGASSWNVVQMIMERERLAQNQRTCTVSIENLTSVLDLLFNHSRANGLEMEAFMHSFGALDSTEVREILTICHLCSYN
jgi:hypothetical protein